MVTSSWMTFLFQVLRVLNTKKKKRVIEKVVYAKLQAKEKKWEFNLQTIEFLVHNITKKGISPPEDALRKTARINSLSTIKELQRILGILNYIKKFIPNFRTMVEPMYNQLKKNSKCLKWTEELDQNL
jgi:putative transposase